MCNPLTTLLEYFAGIYVTVYSIQQKTKATNPCMRWHAVTLWVYNIHDHTVAARAEYQLVDLRIMLKICLARISPFYLRSENSWRHAKDSSMLYYMQLCIIMCACHQTFSSPELHVWLQSFHHGCIGQIFHLTALVMA